MEDILKRLLDAEIKAQHLVDQANAERERIIHEALADAQAADERFTARIPELQASFVDKAQERATQAVGEMQRRYEERRATLNQMAAERREEAIEAAVNVVLDPRQT
jgi:vacuolar-type H+-ATPase subunit H